MSTDLSVRKFFLGSLATAVNGVNVLTFNDQK